MPGYADCIGNIWVGQTSVAGGGAHFYMCRRSNWGCIMQWFGVSNPHSSWMIGLCTGVHKKHWNLRKRRMD